MNPRDWRHWAALVAALILVGGVLYWRVWHYGAPVAAPGGPPPVTAPAGLTPAQQAAFDRLAAAIAPLAGLPAEVASLRAEVGRLQAAIAAGAASSGSSPVPPAPLTPADTQRVLEFLRDWQYRQAMYGQR